MDKFIIRKNNTNFFKSSSSNNNNDKNSSNNDLNKNSSNNDLLSQSQTNETIGTNNETTLKKYICFTDGSTFNNGKKKMKQYGGLGIYYYIQENNTNYDHQEISLSLSNNDKITNNIAELKAIIYLITKIINSSNDINSDTNNNNDNDNNTDKLSYNNELIRIYSDSEYVIKSITQWAKNWQKNNWCKYDKKSKKYKEIANKDLIIQLYNLYNKYNIRFVHVKAHKNEPLNKKSLEYEIWYGNKKADKLAVNASKQAEANEINKQKQMKLTSRSK